MHIVKETGGYILNPCRPEGLLLPSFVTAIAELYGLHPNTCTMQTTQHLCIPQPQPSGSTG